MLVYDITNEKSFDNIKNWIRNIEEVFTGQFRPSFRYLIPLNTLKLTCSVCSFNGISILLVQHASADVEKMVLGNKCDINDKRQVSKDMGEKVRILVDVKIKWHLWFIVDNK